MRPETLWILVAVLLTAACGGRAATIEEPDTGGTAGLTPAAVLETRADEAAILAPPFTAEQIRDEWVEGFSVTMRRRTPDETRIERWTVIAADADGADIEFAAIGDGGAVLGKPVVAHSTWVELRDHASFPADAASREWTTRDTPLGDLEGWLYRVSEEETDAVSEFFFAASLPGAPVWMTTSEGERVVLELEQIKRSRPATP